MTIIYTEPKNKKENQQPPKSEEDISVCASHLTDLHFTHKQTRAHTHSQSRTSAAAHAVTSGMKSTGINLNDNSNTRSAAAVNALLQLHLMFLSSPQGGDIDNKSANGEKTTFCISRWKGDSLKIEKKLITGVRKSKERNLLLIDGQVARGATWKTHDSCQSARHSV